MSTFRDGARRRLLSRSGTVRCALAALLASVAPVGAQLEAQVRVAGPATILPEARLEFLGARLGALHAGGGVGVRPGRSFVLAGLATASVHGADGATDLRIELVGRFLLDPERRSAVSLYAAGGAAALHAEDGDWRGVLVTVLGAEMGRGSWGAFVETGVGGGARVAAGVRRR